MRDITIHAVMNGYIVQVGCQTLVFEGRTVLLGELRRYLDNPEHVEKEYLERFPIGLDQPAGGLLGDAGRRPLGGPRADITRVWNAAARGQTVYEEASPNDPSPIPPR